MTVTPSKLSPSVLFIYPLIVVLVNWENLLLVEVEDPEVFSELSKQPDEQENNSKIRTITEYISFFILNLLNGLNAET